MDYFDDIEEFYADSDPEVAKMWRFYNLDDLLGEDGWDEVPQ